jgi:hypothetical protein
MGIGFDGCIEELDLDRGVPNGTPFTTMGDDRALYVTVGRSQALRLFKVGETVGEHRIAPRLLSHHEIRGPTLAVQDELVIRTGDSQVEPLFLDFQAPGRHGDLALLPDGRRALFIEDDRGLFLPLPDWSPVAAGPVLHRFQKQIRFLRHWTLWRRTTEGPLWLAAFTGSGR